MDFRKSILVAALCLAMPAYADIRTEIDARELQPSNMTVPSSNNSRISFRACDACDLETVRLTPATQYLLNGEVLKFSEFRSAFLTIRRRSNGYALLSIDARSKTVNKVEMTD